MAEQYVRMSHIWKAD
jgi:hypothetical protein